MKCPTSNHYLDPGLLVRLADTVSGGSAIAKYFSTVEYGSASVQTMDCQKLNAKTQLAHFMSRRRNGIFINKKTSAMKKITAIQKSRTKNRPTSKSSIRRQKQFIQDYTNPMVRYRDGTQSRVARNFALQLQLSRIAKIIDRS